MIDKMFIGEVIQCHLNFNDPDTFVVGTVIDANEEWFLLCSISPYGKFDGYILYSQSDVVYIEFNTRYIEKLKTLWSIHHLESKLTCQFKATIDDFLKYAKSSDRVVCIELEKSGCRDLKGFVNRIDNDTIEFVELDDYGSFYGNAKISYASITRCFVEDDESTSLELLSNSGV